MTTYLMRHAPTTFSTAYRVSGDPMADVPLTAGGERAAKRAGSALPIHELSACVSSSFPRCIRTGELITAGTLRPQPKDGLGELDYGLFEGGEFLAYAQWLAKHGPNVRPPGAAESQAECMTRMLIGLKDTLDWPADRLVVGHGLLVSTVRWGLDHEHEALRDVFLPAAPCLSPLMVDDATLRQVCNRLIDDLGRTSDNGREWRVDLNVFPRAARAALGTVSAPAPSTNPLPISED